MADEGRVQNQEDLQRKISTLRRELVTLEVLHQELSSVGKNSRVYTKEGNSDLLFLADRVQTVSQYKKKLDETKRELAFLEKSMMNSTSNKWP